MSLHKKLALHVHQERVYKLLCKNRGRFVPVSDMAEQLNLSLNTTLDALVQLRMKNLATQTVGGWQPA
jgi:predicted ArsR family transcriptional regulator